MRPLALLVVGLALLAGIAATVSGGGTQAELRWVITDLGTLGGKKSRAVAINDNGQIVGVSETGKLTGSPIRHAFLWQSRKLIDLGTLGGSSSYPNAINPGGQIVGTSLTKNGERHAFAWSKGTMRDLGTLGGAQSFAAAINKRGQIVGWSLTKDGEKHACLWERGKISDLGTLGGANSAAVAVNDRGQIVGWSESEATGNRQWSLRVVLWENREVRDLGILGNREAAYPSGWNVNSGEVVGINERSEVFWTTEYTGILWQNGRTTKIPSLSEAPLAMNDLGWIIGSGNVSGTPGLLWRRGSLIHLDFMPLAVNNRGLIVGSRWGSVSGPYIRAITWQNGKRTFLATLGTGQRISTARAVNARDFIVGESEYHAVLWKPKRG